MKPEILKTKYLFLNLLHFLKPKLILDVGSMDGSDSLRFRQMSANSRIIAIEASPSNYKKMILDSRLEKSEIEVANYLIASQEKRLAFYITHDSYSADTQKSINRGSSSLLEPIDKSAVVERIELDAIRLDKFITMNGGQSNDLALWIDVEGAGFDVLESIGDLKKNISLLHIEAEITPKWVGQKLKSDLAELASRFNLVLLATTKNPDQQDLVFINKSLLDKNYVLVTLVLYFTKFIGPPTSRLFRYL
jgi:FkbM family methyltransferase